MLLPLNLSDNQISSISRSSNNSLYSGLNHVSSLSLAHLISQQATPFNGTSLFPYANHYPLLFAASAHQIMPSFNPKLLSPDYDLSMNNKSRSSMISPTSSLSSSSSHDVPKMSPTSIAPTRISSGKFIINILIKIMD